jgi:hypothetical protein
MIAILAGLAAGALHVVGGPDHVAAIAPLSIASGRASWRAGLHWGLGHSAGVVLVAAAALALREVVPLERLSGWSERLVGVTLVGLGMWGVLGSLRRRALQIERGPSSAPHGHAHRGTLRAACAIGTLHGLAGSSHLLGVLPALAFQTRLDALLYLAAFVVGTLGAMTGAAALIGASARERDRRGWMLGTSFAALAVGAVWIVEPLT